MIVSRTPFRISFFGGGTDYPVWYKEHKGAVLATTIDKYCYIFLRYLPPFFAQKYRISYSKVEYTNHIDQIEHPSVRECLKFMGITHGIDMLHAGDLPARTGMGSSSAFTVAMLHALYALKGIMPTKMQLARDAIHVEQELIRENVGSQDQVITAHGGFNRIDFMPQDYIRITPIIYRSSRIEELQQHLMLWFTGISRTASDIATEQIRLTPSKRRELETMYQLAPIPVG